MSENTSIDIQKEGSQSLKSPIEQIHESASKRPNLDSFPVAEPMTPEGLIEENNQHPYVQDIDSSSTEIITQDRNQEPDFLGDPDGKQSNNEGTPNISFQFEDTSIETKARELMSVGSAPKVDVYTLNHVREKLTTLIESEKISSHDKKTLDRILDRYNRKLIDLLNGLNLESPNQMAGADKNNTREVTQSEDVDSAYATPDLNLPDDQ